MRRRLILANWKMNLGCADSLRWVDEVMASEVLSGSIGVGVAPSFVLLPAVATRAVGTHLRVFGQDCHAAAQGAHTGAVSLPMLREVGAEGVIVGHSERRTEFGEGDAVVSAKLHAALASGLDAVLCIGESLEQRSSGATDSILDRQLRQALDGLGDAAYVRLVVAYEPVWAIGTGRTPSVTQVCAAMTTIRAILEGQGGVAASAVPSLYGGSVTRENAAEFLSEPSIDGALVGGASLDARHFIAIIRAAGEV